jgi:hypothetical protein
VFNRKRRLIKIEDIEVTKEKLDVLGTCGKDSFGYGQLMRKVFGGYCCICMGVPYKIATYKVGTAFMLERYCNEHLFHISDNLKGIDEKIEILYR